MSDHETKPCRMCREAISTTAYRCPKCQSWQSATSFLKSNPQTWMMLPLILFPLIFIIPLLRMRSEGEEFAKYRDQIEVIDDKFTIDDALPFNSITTLAKLRNNSPVKWRNVVIEVQYFDKEGNLVATTTEQNHAIVLIPKAEQAVQINLTRGPPSGRCASQKIFLRDAKDASKWP